MLRVKKINTTIKVNEHKMKFNKAKVNKIFKKYNKQVLDIQFVII